MANPSPRSWLRGRLSGLRSANVAQISPGTPNTAVVTVRISCEGDAVVRSEEVPQHQIEFGSVTSAMRKWCQAAGRSMRGVQDWVGMTSSSIARRAAVSDPRISELCYYPVATTGQGYALVRRPCRPNVPHSQRA